MNAKTITVVIIIVLFLTAGGGCIGKEKGNIITQTIEKTKTITKTIEKTTTKTKTNTTTSYYITTNTITKYDTIIVPVTTTIIISNSTTSTIVDSNGITTTYMSFAAKYTYANAPFLVYNISGNMKIITIPTKYSPLLDQIISFIHESIENKYTTYTTLKNYIDDFNPIRIKIMMNNYTEASTPIDFNDLYLSHKYNSLYGPIYYAAYALNKHNPVTLAIEVKDNNIIGAHAGIKNKYYSSTDIKYYDALRYSLYTEYGTLTIYALVLDEYGIATKLVVDMVTNIPTNFTAFQTFANRSRYGIELAITKDSATTTVSYFVDLRNNIATITMKNENNTTTKILTYRNGTLTITTIKKETTINTYYNSTRGSIDAFSIMPIWGRDYNARVVNNMIFYTAYNVSNNTVTKIEATITGTQIVGGTYEEIAIGNITIATGTFVGWVN